MGRRRGQIAMMGSSSLLVKDKNKRQGRGGRRDDSFLHTTDLDDGTTYNRINFQSVTEQSNLEDFLNTAEMANKDFTAERQNIHIITNPGQGVMLTEADMQEITHAQDENRELLKIPRRPHWDETTTKEDLLLQERDSFTDWRRQLKLLEEKEHIQLTPYEKNLDFWRQLWRVIERSDVVVQIVDARNPLLFRCEDLETYVKEVDPNKTVMLLINKADYLTQLQRQAWVDFFNKNGIRAVFFSAMTEKEKMEIDELDQQSLGDLQEESEEEEDDDDEDEKDIDKAESFEEDSEEEDDESEETDVKADRSTEDRLCSGFSESVTLDNDKNNSEVCSGDISHSSSDSVDKGKSGEVLQTSDPPDSSNETPLSLSENHSGIVTAEQLLDVFRFLAQPASEAATGREGGEERVKTVGMVGYPNVGKSSTINVILRQKKLAVSATPGRTKHLQTLYVDAGLMLCDCPGLVFPSFVATKAHLVINGILPIDELRDHISPTNLICKQIPRAVLEATYSIMIPRPSVDDTADRTPTPEELLFAYGGMRGFMTPRGVPDAPRASRYILKDYVKGKLLYCEPPPGLDGAEFQDKDRLHQMEASRPAMKQPPPQIKSLIDKEFFAKRDVKTHSRGKFGVSDHVRVDTLQASGRNSDGPGSLQGSVGGSHSSLASTSSVAGVGKPWKRHNNRNKKEKLRRLHRDLDVY